MFLNLNLKKIVLLMTNLYKNMSGQNRCHKYRG